MDSLLNRYRNITVLLLVIFAQLVLLAYQVKSNQDVRLIRVWAVTAVTPVARVVEGVRSVTVGALENYVLLHNLGEENRRLKEQLGELKMQNQYLKSELSTADRLKALSAFQERTPSKTVAARIIGTGTSANSRVVFIDRGSSSGVMKGMAVVTPDGIVGKVTGAYPTASQVLLITDPTFAAGVISQKHRVHGTVRGQGHSVCLVDYVPNEEQVEPGELFFTSGDDGIFPKGFLVGKVTAIRLGQSFKQILLAPSSLQSGIEEVLVILEGVHQNLPEGQKAAGGVYLLPPPSEESAGAATQAVGSQGPQGTEADRLRERYRQIGEAQGHKFGTGLPGSRPPDFNLKPGQGTAAPKRPAPGVGEQPTPPTGVKPPAATKPTGERSGTSGAPAAQGAASPERPAAGPTGQPPSPTGAKPPAATKPAGERSGTSGAPAAQGAASERLAAGPGGQPPPPAQAKPRPAPTPPAQTAPSKTTGAQPAP